MKQIPGSESLERAARSAAKKLRSLEGPAKRALKGVLCLAFGFLLGRLELPGGIAPLGGAFTAACGPFPWGAAAAAGVMLGAVSGLGLTAGLRSAASVLLIYSALFLLKEWKLSRRSFFAPLAAALMTGLIGGVYLRWSARGPGEWAAWLCEGVLAGFGCVLYRAGLRQEPGRGGTLGRAVLALSLCMALADFRVAGVISPGRCAAACLVLTAAHLGGAPSGALAGLILGLGLDAVGGTPGSCAMALGCAGALGGFGAGKGRLLTALGCVVGNAAAAFWGTEGLLRSGLLYEFFIASVLFMLPTQRFFENIRRTEAPADGALLRYFRGRTALAASAFRELGALLHTEPETQRNDADGMTVFDVAAETVCRRCRDRERCWGREYETTRSAMQAAWDKMWERGSAEAEDFPPWFRDRCLDLRGYSGAVSGALRDLRRRRQNRKRLQADRALLDRQYGDFASALGDLAGVSPGSAREEGKLTRRLSAFLRDYAPGTACSAFRDGNGRLHVELSGAGRSGLTRKPDWLAALSRAAETELSCPDIGGERLQLYEREPLEAEVGVAACCRGGKAPSGDVARSFKSAEGVLYLIVADGMGSGKEAAEESTAAAVLAEKLLRAGIGPETVLRTLNTALLLRSEKRICSLGLDLMSVNLFTGETCVYKYGAAPSYVRSGGQVRTVRGRTPAAGTDDVGPDCVRMQLESGSAAVILSDGAAGAENVEERLRACDPGSLRELAGNILTDAAAKGGWEDDMTVLTLSLRSHSPERTARPEPRPV